MFAERKPQHTKRTIERWKRASREPFLEIDLHTQSEKLRKSPTKTEILSHVEKRILSADHNGELIFIIVFVPSFRMRFARRTLSLGSSRFSISNMVFRDGINSSAGSVSTDRYSAGCCWSFAAEFQYWFFDETQIYQGSLVSPAKSFHFKYVRVARFRHLFQ